VNRFLRYRLVTDADRGIMGIPNRDLVRTPHNDPKEEVEFSSRIRGIRQVHVDFKVPNTLSKAKPDMYDGTVIAWDLWDRTNGNSPARPEDLNRHVLAEPEGPAWAVERYTVYYSALVKNRFTQRRRDTKENVGFAN
jgi:hypothetical protein